MNKYGKRMQQEEDIGFPIMEENPTIGTGPVSDAEAYQNMMQNSQDGFLMKRALERQMQNADYAKQPRDVNYFLPEDLGPSNFKNQMLRLQRMRGIGPERLGFPPERNPNSMGEMTDLESTMPPAPSTPTPTPSPSLNRSPNMVTPADYIDPKTGMPVHEFYPGLDVKTPEPDAFSSEYAKELQPSNRFNRTKSKIK